MFRGCGDSGGVQSQWEAQKSGRSWRNGCWPGPPLPLMDTHSCWHSEWAVGGADVPLLWLCLLGVMLTSPSTHRVSVTCLPPPRRSGESCSLLDSRHFPSVRSVSLEIRVPPWPCGPDASSFLMVRGKEVVPSPLCSWGGGRVCSAGRHLPRGHRVLWSPGQATLPGLLLSLDTGPSRQAKSRPRSP